MNRAMDLESPAYLLDAPHRRSSLLEGRALISERECIGTGSSEAHGRVDATVAPAGGGIGDQAAVGARECHNRAARPLKTLAKDAGCDAQGLRGLRSG